MADKVFLYRKHFDSRNLFKKIEKKEKKKIKGFVKLELNWLYWKMILVRTK